MQTVMQKNRDSKMDSEKTLRLSLEGESTMKRKTLSRSH